MDGNSTDCRKCDISDSFYEYDSHDKNFKQKISRLVVGWQVNGCHFSQYAEDIAIRIAQHSVHQTQVWQSIGKCCVILWSIMPKNKVRYMQTL